jgi:hypothetical protein
MSSCRSLPILNQWHPRNLLFVVSLCMSLTRSGYRELGLELFELGEEHSHQPKQPSRAEEKRYDEPSGYWWPPTYSKFQLAHLDNFQFNTFLCNCGLCTYRVVLNPYTTSMWILVVIHLFQLAYFGSFHVSTSFCTSRAVLGL